MIYIIGMALLWDWPPVVSCEHKVLIERKFSSIYFSPKDFWIRLLAVKKVVKEARVSENVAKLWLMWQAI